MILWSQSRGDIAGSTRRCRFVRMMAESEAMSVSCVVYAVRLCVPFGLERFRVCMLVALVSRTVVASCGAGTSKNFGELVCDVWFVVTS